MEDANSLVMTLISGTFMELRSTMSALSSKASRRMFFLVVAPQSR